MLHLQECEGENLETPLALQESLPVFYCQLCLSVED